MKSLPIDELTEILVFGDQNSCIQHSRLEDDAVFPPLDFFRHPSNVVPVIANSGNDQTVHAVFGEAIDSINRNPRPPCPCREMPCQVPLWHENYH